MNPANFLGAEPLIIERLKAMLPVHVHVLSTPELADVAADQQPTPAVHVVYGGYRAEAQESFKHVVSVFRVVNYHSTGHKYTLFSPTGKPRRVFIGLQA